MWGHMHTDQSALRILPEIFSILKTLKGNYLGALSARLKAHIAPSHGACARFQPLDKLYLRAVLERLRAVLAPRSLF